ncbi:hypothetical protein [Paracoccus aminophilus]|uniref:Uncharacterized protein n=1 Tax=Paracoccus aminophilus JCM 7686 TaxID=1367847 RepID=S5Y357_PARAH|nr:hypothetical protein [Paracoccus aminophilus]AGT10180.1 hypothetical protein JCM7686_3144 [Paracoccus aminophilus JCM 7686]
MRRAILIRSLIAALICGLAVIAVSQRFALVAERRDAALLRKEVQLLRRAGQGACLTPDQIATAATALGWHSAPVGSGLLRVTLAEETRKAMPRVILLQFDPLGCLRPAP